MVSVTVWPATTPTKVRETSTYTKDETKDEYLVLNKRRLKSYGALWDQIQSDSASSLFEELLEEQHGKHSAKT